MKLLLIAALAAQMWGQQIEIPAKGLQDPGINPVVCPDGLIMNHGSTCPTQLKFERGDYLGGSKVIHCKLDDILIRDAKAYRCTDEKGYWKPVVKAVFVINSDIEGLIPPGSTLDLTAKPPTLSKEDLPMELQPRYMVCRSYRKIPDVYRPGSASVSICTIPLTREKAKEEIRTGDADYIYWLVRVED